MSRPLFEHFPGLEASIPALYFAKLPTPLEVHSYEHGAPIWVKRDDLSHNRYGGNKVRKLEFILAEALQQKRKELVTFGAIGTNHGVATALFCQEYDIRCRVFLFDQPLSKTVLSNLRCMQALGAELDYKGSLLNTVLAYYRSTLFNRSAYHLFAGGSNIPGCMSFVNAAFELKQQVEEGLCPEPDLIICPVGSSATMAGLTLGCHLAGLKSRVKGVRVAPSHLGIFPACTPGTVKQLMHQTFRFLRQKAKALPKSQLPAIDLEENYFGEGYGCATQAGTQASQWFQSRGLSMEQTYTAKAAACVLDRARANPDQTILYWHTFNSADLTPITQCANDHALPSELHRMAERFKNENS